MQIENIPTAESPNLTAILIGFPPFSALRDPVIKIRPLLLTLLPVLALATPAAAQMRVDARIQMSSGSCAGCDLSNKAMNGVRLSNADLKGSLFNNSNLSGGTLDGSDLSGAHFKSALMYRVSGTGVTMPRAVLEDATLTEANLSHSKLANTNFSRADLSRAVFTDTDFRGARFDSANLSDAKLSGANFSGADLSSTKGLKQVQLDDACGDDKTRLPIGLSLPYCDGVTLNMADHATDGLSENMAHVAERLDRAIADIENLLAASNPNDRALRTRLQRIHSDLVQSKTALTQ